MDQYLSIPRGQTSVILRVKIRDTSDNNGAGKTGLAFNTAGNIISVIANNGATPIASYTTTGATIETVTTLGTYAAPTATKCRFKEVDATNHPGLYEVQFADSIFATASARALTVTIVGATDAEQTDLQIQLTSSDNLTDVNVAAISGDTTAADNLESGYDGTGWNGVLQGGTLTVGTQTSVTLSAGSADNDAYNGCLMVIQDATDAFQKAVVSISDYVGSTKVATLAAAPSFTIATSDKFTILASNVAAALDGTIITANGSTFNGTLVLNTP